MLFNSYTYLLAFLPLMLAGYYLLKASRPGMAIRWLVLGSLVYYAWWVPPPTDLAGAASAGAAGADGDGGWFGSLFQHVGRGYLWLIVASSLGNYLAGVWIGRWRDTRRGRLVLTFGIAANLALLAYYKYYNFLVDLVADLTPLAPETARIVLPLAISFFTFQQIAFLVDRWKGLCKPLNLGEYFLFVCFFPQLIAGPIVHHREMLGQFRRLRRIRMRWVDVSIGLTILAIGLFKKVVIADSVSRTVIPLFGAVAGGRELSFAEAWAAALAYAVQIYFDFSGYSDMAIGSARLFGIRLPLNFHSPYKAGSITEFWRRWHITLSRFLRDYLYIPLGGNRRGTTRRYGNLMVTMLLGGLWHGAGWTFVVWGGLHGLFLCVDHFWKHLRKVRGWPAMPRVLGWALTFIAVTFAWVLFRAENFASATSMLASMCGLNGLGGWPPATEEVIKSSRALRFIPWLLLAFILPNTQQFMARYSPAVNGREFLRPGRRRWWHWRPTLPWALATLAVLLVIALEFDKPSEFIYFQF